MKRCVIRAGCALVLSLTLSSLLYAQTSTQQVVIDATAPVHPFPHFWEHIFGSGRARLAMRASYRNDLRSVKQITGAEYIRFHGIFLDDMGVYDEDAEGKPIYNFSYVDQVYDGLLQNGIRPYVEISFMPYKLASKDAIQAFWYKPNVSPPKDWDKWDDLVRAFTAHLVTRYGIDEVAKWYFEVWNEPNIDFWAGEPKQETYWELYDHTATTIKSVNSRLRVGGPSTAQTAWVGAFIQHCSEKHIPVDFVSTHVYANDPVEKVFGTGENVPRDKFVCNALANVHRQIKSSSSPELPLIVSEFNASYMTEPSITDSIYMGPWMADTIRQCDGFVDEMSYWTFSDVFEEQGVIKQPFYGGYGLLAEGGIPKPAFSAFKLLHNLGNQRIAVDSDSVLATRSKEGKFEVAAWNLIAPQEQGAPKTISLKFEHFRPKQALISRVDHEHGDPHTAYEKIGSPRYPTQAQYKDLIKSTELPPPQRVSISNGELSITLPADGLALIELR